MHQKILCVSNTKGGCGKTTITMNLAGAFKKKALRVAVIDADPQSTAVRWASSADEDNPFPANVFSLSAAEGKVHQEVRKYVADYDICIIDCPPSVDSAAPQSAMLVADLVLVPMIPSPADAWAGVAAKKLIEHVNSLREQFAETSGSPLRRLEARIVPNMVRSGTALTKEVLRVLANFGIPMTKTTLGMRIAFQEAAMDATSVHSLGRNGLAAADEIDDLADEVLAILGIKVKAKAVQKKKPSAVSAES